MDFTTNTEPIKSEITLKQENMLLAIIKEISAGDKISTRLKGKVNRIIADCDLTHHTSLHRLSTSDESTSTVLGFMQQTAAELTFDEQAELNQLIIQQIQIKIPAYNNELDKLRVTSTTGKKSRKEQIKELQEGLDDKLNKLQEQESEKVELMLEWLNHRVEEVNKFSDNSSELLNLKTKILDLKSKILHLQILQNIFTETNQSIKAYSEVHKDLLDSIKGTESRIKEFHAILEKDV